jgi:hypothetical protein
MQNIETSIFKGLLFSEQYSRKVYPFLDASFFDGGYKTLFKTYKHLYDKYNNPPKLEAIAISLQKSPIGDTEYEDIVEIVEEASKGKDEMPDLDWLIDETEEYCKDKAVYNAIYSSINILEGDENGMDKHAIPDLLDSALSVSFDTSIGMEFFDDAEARYNLYTSEDERLALPLSALQRLTNGGLKKKSLSIALAFTNVGKSSLMCYLAGELMKQGKNVLYISMEMAEEVVYERVEANLYNTTTDDLKNMSKDEFMSKVDNLKSKTNGKLFVKEYPTSGAHAGHFRHLLKELKQKKKFNADIVFVDYVNICASSRYTSMSGVNSYSYVKAIAEELRGLGVEFEVPVFSATQTNRGAANEDSPDLTATSESIGLPQTADFMMAITTNEVLQENNRQVFHLLKTRWGNKTKVKPQVVGIDFNKMRYYDASDGGDAKTVEDINQDVGKRLPKKKDPSEIDWD